MSEHTQIYYARGRIEAWHDPRRAAVTTKYRRTYDPHGVVLPAGVRGGLDYATENGLRNRVVDVSEEQDKMSETDSAWEGSQEFRQIFRNSTIRNIVFVLPSSADRTNTSWSEDFATELAVDFVCHVTTSMDETAAVLDGSGGMQ